MGWHRRIFSESNGVFSFGKCDSEGEAMSSAGQIVGLDYSSMVLASFEESRPNELHWYAVRTRSRHEKIASQQLLTRGIETFLPVVTQTHRWSDRKKQVEVPLFSGYTFVRLAYSSNEQRIQVLQTHGVAGFVGVQRTGVPIPDNQIEDIRTLLSNKVDMKTHSFLKIGQRVRVRGGAYSPLSPSASHARTPTCY